MELLLVSVAVLVGSGLLSLAVGRAPRPSSWVGAGGVLAAAAIGLSPVYRVLATGEPALDMPIAWAIPTGSFTVGLDVLSAWFLVPVLIIPPLAAVFGCEYLQAYAPRKSLGASWFFYNLVVAGMIVVTIAREGLLFLIAWEVMALASYFLVVFEHEREEVRQAGWTYLVASHLGTAFLLALFVLLGTGSGSLEFAEGAEGPTGITRRLADAYRDSPHALDVIFVLAVVGFGTKAGFMPFHVWLPEAYPAAIGHSPAVLSGVMSKMGIYGLVRILSLFTGIEGFRPPNWWAWLLIAIGMLSGIAGILSAISQRHLRRILAYSSIENMGIIAIGLGTALLGLSSKSFSAMAVFGFAGALLHVLNHSLFKGLLFLGAGAVEQSAGTGNINLLGGLLKQLPAVGIPFIAGSVAIAGLPPFNGFVSEFLIYRTALGEEVLLGGVSAVAALSGIAALTLIGGFAAVCFTMVVGIAFLGQPRSEQAASVKPVAPLMQAPLWLLAAACLAAGMFSPQIMTVLAPVVTSVTHMKSADVGRYLVSGTNPTPARELLEGVVTATGCLIALAIVLAVVRWRLLKGREVAESGTWGCGFYKPEASMQYTGSSFAQPLVDLVRPLLRTRKHIVRPRGLFAHAALLWTATPDMNRELIYAPIFRGIGNLISRLRWLQHGRLHLYVLYVAITIVVLLFWSFGRR
ncbi:MAG TPA: proton-conducting transporter membrane subunit [Planctomycetaceae bacterium]|nr:proton-conducting transporter membrane subunit [Planctomycetaceae bacterium]